MSTFFADRLRSARKMKSLSLDDLCLACDGIVSKQALSKYERGTMKPSSKVLIALSNAFEVSPDYFIKPPTISFDSIEFRKRKSFSPKKLDSIREIVRYDIEKYVEIEDILGINPEVPKMKKIPVQKKEDVENAAKEIRKRWKQGEAGIVNVISILEENGIKVILLNDEKKMDGMSCFANGVPVIILNRSGNVERDRFTSLHELGHLILDFADSFSEEDQEHLCHLFANEMLIPKSLFLEIIGKKRKNIDMSELKDIQSNFGISVDALMFKAKENEVISEQSYRRYCILRRQKKLEIADQSNALEETPTRFERLVHRGIASDVISLSKASELLEKPLGIVRDQVSLV
ncbi:MAG: ImmA/IrrE family metallo-endopeptidase [Clostridia bacterium]|nr:ImmA/IrrE family metallo-endopeptidase [Clostridia bacterium]